MFFLFGGGGGVTFFYCKSLNGWGWEGGGGATRPLPLRKM